MTLSENFNPLPRKEGDFACQVLDILSSFISIHSLVKRETIVVIFAITNYKNFNPLPRKEGDAMFAGTTMALSKISIHSLVKRETTKNNRPTEGRKFQSTPS